MSSKTLDKLSIAVFKLILDKLWAGCYIILLYSKIVLKWLT